MSSWSSSLENDWIFEMKNRDQFLKNWNSSIMDEPIDKFSKNWNCSGNWPMRHILRDFCPLCLTVNCMNFLPRFKLWVRLESRNKLKRLTRANIYLRVIAAISSYQNSLVVITWILAKIIKNELWALARGILDFYSWFTGILGLLGKILELHETRLWSTT